MYLHALCVNFKSVLLSQIKHGKLFTCRKRRWQPLTMIVTSPTEKDLPAFFFSPLKNERCFFLLLFSSLEITGVHGMPSANWLKIGWCFPHFHYIPKMAPIERQNCGAFHNSTFWLLWVHIQSTAHSQCSQNSKCTSGRMLIETHSWSSPFSGALKWWQKKQLFVCSIDTQ